MKIQLILARNTTPGQHTEEVWQSVCNKSATSLLVHDIKSLEARTLIDQINIKTFPTLIANEKIIAVGNPDHQTASHIIQSLLSGILDN